MLYQSIVSPAKMGDRSYIYNRVDAANYAAFAPITWCLFFGWIIFTSHTGNGGRKLNQNRLKSYASSNVYSICHKADLVSKNYYTGWFMIQYEGLHVRG